MPAAQAHLLPIPPRLQWRTDNGYCGETAIQSVGLYFGAWISQGIIRRVAGGEVLLGVNESSALEALHFRSERWSPDPMGLPPAEAFLAWMKARLLRGEPCLMAVYLEGFPHGAYDHIVPVVGVSSACPGSPGFEPEDELIYHNLFSFQVVRRPFRSLPATRERCRQGLIAGGNIPEGRPYGLAVMGWDSQAELPRVRLAVDSPFEPDVDHGERPTLLRGTIWVSGLQPGQRYAIFRFDRLEDVPCQGGLKAFAQSRFSSRTVFQAREQTWSMVDSRFIPSGGVAYYRCVPLP